jgi:hypothetical protein
MPRRRVSAEAAGRGTAPAVNAGGRAVVTLAVGKPVYLQLAVNLARSFAWWHRSDDIRFAIATDVPDRIPPDLRAQVIALRDGEFGTGFTPKLYLDRFAPAERTLFLDADSLCVGSVEPLFEQFAGRPVSVIGGTIAAGEWFGDVARICHHFGLPALPKFNGGVYYIERGPRSTEVYDTARALEPHYDTLGLVRLRGRPNEELLVAIAMAIHGLGGIPDDGTLMAEPLNFACGLSVDVLGGRALLRNTPGHPRYQPSWPLLEARPRIVHFLGHHTERAPYSAEALRLERVMAAGWPPWVATLAARLTKSVPQAVADRAKDLLRPVFRAVFGTRPIAPSPRV